MRYVVKLTFSGPISIGTGDVTHGDGFHGIVHSDTLFSAIANEWARTCEDEVPLEGLVERLNGPSPPFRISSALPFFGSDYYLPTPLGTTAIYREKLRDIPFLDLFDFMELAAGNEELLRKKRISNPLEWVISPFTAPRVAIDRFTTATNIYQTSGYRLNPGGGLYFILEINDDAIWKTLSLCIRLLGETGLGGERSVGYGRFTAEFVEADQLPGWHDLLNQSVEGSGCWYSLSLCCPRDHNEARLALSYNLLIRKGWIFSYSSLKQMKRRQCRVFGEGSIFRSNLKGFVADVTPKDFAAEHRIYRYGAVTLLRL
jgi:CRISPR-associated protein Csm4